MPMSAGSNEAFYSFLCVRLCNVTFNYIRYVASNGHDVHDKTEGTWVEVVVADLGVVSEGLRKTRKSLL
jgi:hypothetical protein